MQLLWVGEWFSLVKTRVSVFAWWYPLNLESPECVTPLALSLWIDYWSRAATTNLYWHLEKCYTVGAHCLRTLNMATRTHHRHSGLIFSRVALKLLLLTLGIHEILDCPCLTSSRMGNCVWTSWHWPGGLSPSTTWWCSCQHPNCCKTNS